MLKLLHYISDKIDKCGECCSGIKRIAPSFIFEVALPSADVFSDLSLIIPWYLSGHWKYAISMSVPLYLQFSSTTLKWNMLENKKNKRWSAILLILQCWPQWRALQLILLDYKKDGKFEIKKQELMREVTSTEPFLEAWPSAMILTMIWVPVFFNHVNNGLSKVDYEQYCIDNPKVNECAIFSGPGGVTWFFISFGISTLTGSLGITRFLQVGPFSVLSSEGRLAGILTWKFILAFSAVLSSAFSKGILAAMWIGMANNEYMMKDIGILLGVYLEGSHSNNKSSCTHADKCMEQNSPYTINDEDRIVMRVINLIVVTLILPNLLLSFISIAITTGVNMKFMYAIARYPGSVVLPIATYFAIGIKYAFCPETKEKRKYLGFSKRCSVANLILNIIMQAFMYILLMASLQSENNDKHHSIGFLTVFFLALAFNITYLSLDQPCCCSSSQECYCTFCCGPKCFIQDVQVIDLQYDEKIIIRLN